MVVSLGSVRMYVLEKGGGEREGGERRGWIRDDGNEPENQTTWRKKKGSQIVTYLNYFFPNSKLCCVQPSFLSPVMIYPDSFVRQRTELSVCPVA